MYFVISELCHNKIKKCVIKKNICFKGLILREYMN